MPCVYTLLTNPQQLMNSTFIPHTILRYRTISIDGLDIFYREVGDPIKPT
ncbi:MAG: Hydrolase, alpha/beta fold family, partial [uncultured Chloroflexia bacterium]